MSKREANSLQLISHEAEVYAQRRPVGIFVRGRHETGKSTLLNLLLATREGDYPLRIIDADTNNNTLADWNPGVIVCSGSGEARRLEVESHFNWQMEVAGSPERGDLMADLGGDDMVLPRLGAELGYAEAMVDEGIDPVLFYVVGTDVRHLKPIDDMEEGKLFCPPRTVIAFNAGLARVDQLPSEAYAEVRNSDTIKKLLDRKARIVTIPALDPECMGKLKGMVREWNEEADACKEKGISFARPRPNLQWAVSPDGRRGLGHADHLRVKALFRHFVSNVRKPLEDWIPA